MSYALKGVFLMIASTQAVNTSNLQDDAALYETQFAQYDLTTDLAQLSANAETELWSAAPDCKNPDGTPIVCTLPLLLEEYTCECFCPGTSTNDCVYPLVFNPSTCNCSSSLVVIGGDVGIADDVLWNPCWGISSACPPLFVWNPLTCVCDC